MTERSEKCSHRSGTADKAPLRIQRDFGNFTERKSSKLRARHAGHRGLCSVLCGGFLETQVAFYDHKPASPHVAALRDDARLRFRSAAQRSSSSAAIIICSTSNASFVAAASAASPVAAFCCSGAEVAGGRRQEAVLEVGPPFGALSFIEEEDGFCVGRVIVRVPPGVPSVRSCAPVHSG